MEIAVNIITSSVTVIGLSGLVAGNNNTISTTMWSILILISQLATVLKNQFMIMERILALKLYLPETDELLDKLSKDWRLIAEGEYTNDEIRDLCDKYETKGTELKNKYLNSYHFPISKKITNSADDKTIKLLIEKFNCRKEDIHE